MRISISLFSLGLVFSSARAEELFLKSRTIEVEGVGDMSLGQAKARETAIQNGLRGAVEQVVGVIIQSAFSSHQRELFKNGQNEMSSQVEEKVLSQSAGYIESYKILSESKDTQVYKLKLSATVKAASLQNELLALQKILAESGYPKIMLLLTERYTSQAGAAHIILQPSVNAVIESALLKAGFELVAKDQAEQLRKESLEAFDTLLGDNQKVAEIASRHGAEVALVGSSEVKFSAFNELGSELFYLSSVINLRAVNASTAKILSSNEHTGRGKGVNEDTARVDAVRDAGPKVVEELMASLVRSWQAEQGQGKRFRVVLYKVENYGRLARPFIKAIGGLPNMVAVKELNFGGARLEIEVIYKGSKEALLDGIFERVATVKTFESLDKVLDRGDTLEFSL